MKTREIILVGGIIVILIVALVYLIQLPSSSDAVFCAHDLYLQAQQEGMQFESQCLGICDNYAVDIVSVPRSDADNLPKNQCDAFNNGDVTGFIELDRDGNLVRTVG